MKDNTFSFLALGLLIYILADKIHLDLLALQILVAECSVKP